MRDSHCGPRMPISAVNPSYAFDVYVRIVVFHENEQLIEGQYTAPPCEVKEAITSDMVPLKVTILVSP
jgi:hypothetical protein